MSTIIKFQFTENTNKIISFHLKSQISISDLSAWQPTTTTHNGYTTNCRFWIGDDNIVRKSGNNNKIKRMDHYECIHQFSKETWNLLSAYIFNEDNNIYYAKHFSLTFNWNSNDVNESNTCDYKIHYFLSCTFQQNSLKITIVITNHVQTWKLKNNCELCWRNSILIESSHMEMQVISGSYW